MAFNLKYVRHSMALTLLAVTCLGAASGQNSAKSGQAAPDNTRVNDRDKSGTEATADRQKENPSDRAITQQIRKAVLQDKSLSAYAHNVKIITQDGQVKLKGPVQDQNEKETIASKAADVAGTGKVNNQLTLKQ